MVDKSYNPAEHRVPPGSGRSSGEFAGGRVTQKPQHGSRASSNTGGGGGGGTAGGGGGGASGSQSQEPSNEAKIDEHARAMAQMDLQQAAQIKAQIKTLQGYLQQINAEIKYWNQPFKPQAPGSSTTSTGQTGSGGTAGTTPGAAAGASTTSTGSTSPSSTSSNPYMQAASASSQNFQQYIQNLKAQRSQLKEQISDLQSQVKNLQRRAAQWMVQAKSSPNPEMPKIQMTVAQLNELMRAYSLMAQ